MELNFLCVCENTSLQSGVPGEWGDEGVGARACEASGARNGREGVSAAFARDQYESVWAWGEHFSLF